MGDNSMPTETYREKWEQVRSAWAEWKMACAEADAKKLILGIRIGVDPDFLEQWKKRQEFYEEVQDRANEVLGLLK